MQRAVLAAASEQEIAGHIALDGPAASHHRPHHNYDENKPDLRTRFATMQCINGVLKTTADRAGNRTQLRVTILTGEKVANLDQLSKRIAITVLAAVTLLYAGDYVIFQHKLNTNGGAAALGSVTSYYGTALKDGKMEIFTDQPLTETCAHSLFPHSGYHPCWYANRNTVKPIG